MGWRTDSPLVSLTDEEQNGRAKALWERESLGGITEDNNRLPRPVVWLLGLTIISAFLMTFPLWGQRPSAAIFEDYIKLMDDPQVQAIASDEEKMSHIVQRVKSQGTPWEALQDRHPVTMDDLRMIKDQIVELTQKGNSVYGLDEYTVVGDKVVLANFEGNWKENAPTVRERKQPWWDKGYTIDVFYVTYFCLAVMIVVKRLPEYNWQPTHHGH